MPSTCTEKKVTCAFNKVFSKYQFQYSLEVSYDAQRTNQHLTRPASQCAIMYKNQLQERAHKEHVDPPTYTSTQTGPQHAPRFTATVRFNGAEFRSPDDASYPTSKQAELAAALVALQSLGPPSGAGPVDDEQNTYKNMLQELTQKAGVALPMYTTVPWGPPHQRRFTCMVEVGRVSIQGECALTVKDAEKNAAMFALSVIKRCAEGGGSGGGGDPPAASPSTHGNPGTPAEPFCDFQMGKKQREDTEPFGDFQMRKKQRTDR